MHRASFFAAALAAWPVAGVLAAPTSPPLAINSGQLDEYEVHTRLGVGLADGTTPGRQPLEWFGRRVEVEIPDGPVRRVVSEAVRFLTGSSLQAGDGQAIFALPPARITAVRRDVRSESEQLVLELDRPAFFQTAPRPAGLQLTVQAAAISPAISGMPGLQVTPVGESTRVELPGRSGSFPVVTTLDSPPRIVVEWRTGGRYERLQRWTADVIYHQWRLVWEGQPRRIEWLEFAPGTARIEILRTVGLPLQTLSALARVSGAWAAVNGGFFNRNTGEALGVLRTHGVWLTGTVPGLKPRGVVGWSEGGEWRFERLNLPVMLDFAGKAVSAAGLNTTAYGEGIAVLTPEWSTAPYQAQVGETIAIVRSGRVDAVVEPASGPQPVLVPVDGFLAVARQAGRSLLRALTPATPAQYRIETISGSAAELPNVLGAGPLLIQKGRIVLDAGAEQFRPDVRADGVARTVIARRADRGILAVISTEGGMGMSLESLARFLVDQWQVSDALNLDGGGSSALYLGGHRRDSSEGNFERSIANGLGIWVKLPR